MEDAIEEIQGVRRCVVFGVDSRNPERLEDVAACIQIDDDVTLLEVRKALRGKLLRYECPYYWWEAPALSPAFESGLSREERRANLRARQASFIHR